MTRRLELARQRFGTDVDLRVADQGEPPPLQTARSTMSSLVLHYLEDWAAPLAELRRVLKPGGRPMLSLNHPLVFRLANPGADYSAPVE